MLSARREPVAAAAPGPDTVKPPAASAVSVITQLLLHHPTLSAKAVRIRGDAVRGLLRPRVRRRPLCARAQFLFLCCILQLCGIGRLPRLGLCHRHTAALVIEIAGHTRRQGAAGGRGAVEWAVGLQGESGVGADFDCESCGAG